MASPLRAAIVFAVLGALAGAAHADGQNRTLQGTIVRFECGDNCYLVVAGKTKAETTGLCAAPECRTWNENAAMPKRFVGKRVRVTVGTGQQRDANGDAQGDFPAFTSIKFLN